VLKAAELIENRMQFSRRKFALKIVAFLGAPLFLVNCATMAPPQPPSLELPQPPTDLHAVRKGEKVILTWTVPGRTTDRQRIHTVGLTRICRGLEAQLTQCGTPVGEAKAQSPAMGSSETKSSADKSSAAKSSAQKVTATYIDTLPTEMESDDPAAFVMYAVEVLNSDGRGAGISNQVRVPTIRTLPPPEDFAARVTSKGIELTWTNDLSAASAKASVANGVRYVYRVYRREEGSNESSVVASIPAGGAPSLTLTDSNFDWEKTYWYRAETATVISVPDKPEQQIEGADTPELKVFADDVFPPAVPSGLQAVFSGPGQPPFIDLIWAPVTDADLDGYNVYRREEGSGEERSAPVKLNVALVKTPAYRDTNVQSGKTYLYSVAAVDIRGNESARSEEASERVP
jgi:hypothetical protein